MTSIKKLSDELETAKANYIEVLQKRAVTEEYISARENKIDMFKKEQKHVEIEKKHIMENLTQGTATEEEADQVRTKLSTIKHKLDFLNEEIEAAKQINEKHSEDLGGLLYNRRNLARSHLLSHVASTITTQVVDQCIDAMTDAFSSYVLRNGYVANVDSALRTFLFDSFAKEIGKRYAKRAPVIKKQYGIDF